MNSLLEKGILSLARTLLQDIQGCVKSTNGMNMITFVVTHTLGQMMHELPQSHCGDN